MEQWQGQLDLGYGNYRGVTKLIHNRGVAPLKVQRVLYDRPKSIAQTIILHTAGGMVGGDRLNISVDLGANTHSLITTAASSKVYFSEKLPQYQLVNQKVDSNSILEWLPQETIIFNGANYHQESIVELAENAIWMGWEIFRFGRTARGEKFLSGQWKSRTTVTRNQLPLWIDQQYFLGSEETTTSYHALANYPILGSFALVGKVIDSPLITEMRDLFPGDRHKIGVTQLMEGVLCRYRGDSSTEVKRWFIAVWKLLRTSQYQLAATTPRVWLI
jgi:urease accessory protein